MVCWDKYYSNYCMDVKMNKPNKKDVDCNCFIGIYHNHNEHLYKNNVVEILTFNSNNSKQIAKCGFGTGIEPLEYLDGRRGFARLFKFCPKCGNKINWRKIKSNFKGK